MRTLSRFVLAGVPCLLLPAASTATAAARFDLAATAKVVQLSDPQISPDGRFIALVVSRANLVENRSDAEIVLVEIATKAQRALTRDRRGVRAPRWAADGGRLAFLASVEGKSQLFVLPLAGGDAVQVSRSPTGVQEFAWRPDGKALAYTALDEEPKREGEERFNRSFEVGHNHFLQQDAPRPSHLWLAPAEGGSARRLTSGAWTLPVAFPPGPQPPAPSWSPDSRALALVKVASVYSGDFDQSAVQVLDAETGALRALTGRARNEAQPAFSPDGSSVAYWYPRDGDSRNVTELHVAPAAGGEGRSITASLDRHMLRGIWMPDGKALLVSANDRTTTGLWLQPLDGPARRLELRKLVASANYGLDASVSRGGRIALVASEAQRPNELFWMASANAKPERLTELNSETAALELGRIETVEWDGPDGLRMDGVVTYPPGFEAGRKYPLVLYIHGGPRATSKEAFSARAQLLAAQGWIVFEPNYRGSDNRGNAFARAIADDAGAGPGRDVMSGIELLERRGSVDATRIAVSGWSYGGYMTSWLIGNYPEVWRAAVAGAAVTDLTHQYDLGDANVRRGRSLGGSPYTDPKRMQRMAEQSPISYAPRVRTPTLILALTGDYRVPVTQSYRLYHALRDNGVPVKFIAYPLPGHNASDPVHQRDVNRRWIEWLRTYLGPAEATASR